jgi:hypothetical protein
VPPHPLPHRRGVGGVSIVNFCLTAFIFNLTFSICSITFWSCVAGNLLYFVARHYYYDSYAAFSSKWNPKMMVTYSRNNFSFPEEKQTRKKVPEKYLEPSMLDHLCYKKWCEWDLFSNKLISSEIVFIAMHITYPKPTIMEVSSWQKHKCFIQRPPNTSY